MSYLKAKKPEESLWVDNPSLHFESTLKELSLCESQIEIKCSGLAITHIFEKNPSLPGIILLDRNQFYGAVSRRCFFESMSRPYSLDLFSNRPIQVFHDLNCRKATVLPIKTSILAAVRQALSRPPEDVYEPIVVCIDPSTYRILDMYELLLAQTRIHELTNQALQQSQEALYREKELAQVTLHSIGDAVVTTDARGYVQSLNPVAEYLTGWSSQEAEGLPISQVFKIIHEITGEWMPNPVETALQLGQTVEISSGEVVMINRRGNRIAIDDSAAPIRAPNGQIVGAVMIFHDVTESRNLARQLSWQATHDALTGLVNRQEFERRLERAVSEARFQGEQHTLCYMDLDRFKAVNDTCGHQAGDDLLRQVATVLQTEVRKSDVLARLGGDEFGLLLSYCPLEQGLRIANTLCQKINEFHFVWENHTFTIGVSIGLTLVDSSSLSASTCLNLADTACYAAKKGGRNRVVR